MLSRTIAIANNKGGVGKTTTTVNLGAALAHQGCRVLLIDLDSQCNLTHSFPSMYDSAPASTIWDALADGAPLSVSTLSVGKYGATVDLVAGSPCMSGYDGPTDRLRGALDSVRPNYDYILLDCPPSLGLVTVNAMVACDDLYVPMVPELLPLMGLADMVEAVEALRTIKPTLAITGIILTMYRRQRGTSAAIANEVRRQYNDNGQVVFNTVIRDSAALSSAPSVGTIYDYLPNSIGALDYNALAVEVLERHYVRLFLSNLNNQI